MISLNVPLIISFFISLAPALVWVHFWLQEKKHGREPIGLLILAFLLGFVAVGLSISAQHFFLDSFPVGIDDKITVIVWATIEEILKAGLIGLFIMLPKFNKEPIDTVIYMLVVAIGFATLENTLYLLEPFTNTEYLYGVMSGNMRFIGASLVHTVSSGAIGIAASFAFYKSWRHSVWYFVCGTAIAISIHSLFNLSIMHATGAKTMLILGTIWLVMMVMILLLEDVKRITSNPQ